MPPPTIPVAFKTLVGLLGKDPRDAAVLGVIAMAGKTSVKSDYIIAKEAGFDFSLDVPTGGKKKVLSTLFLYAPSADGHRGYVGLPKGFDFVSRKELLARNPEPDETWKIGKGKVPASTPGVSWDSWTLDGFEICASYSEGTVRHFNVTLPDEVMGGRDVSTHPLHFETKPHDAPPNADLVGMGLLVAWAAKRFGLPAKHVGTQLGKDLLARKISPREFLIGACNSRLSTLDFEPQGAEFIDAYINSISIDDDEREKADKKIGKLLRHKTADRGPSYNDDFLGTFRDAVKNPSYVPDSWEAVDRISPILDARLADWKVTSFQTPPDLALYEKAAKLRDARVVEAVREEAEATKVDANLAEDLVALIGRSLKDADVKATLGRASLPIGKKIDEQANPAIGVSYMGTKLLLDGEKQLGIAGVTFHAGKQKSYIRGIGAEVEFIGWPTPLPMGLELGMQRDAVRKKLGKPTSTYEDCDYWRPKNRLLTCTFARKKLVEVYFGIPRND
jgi:hypothetical protein